MAWTRLACLLVCLAGCARAGKEVREHTYPPDFRYITEAQLSSSMWRLAHEAAALDQLLRQPAPPSVESRAKVVAHLSRMGEEAARLDGDHLSNHPLLDRHLDRFRHDLAMAKEEAEREPPSYFLAGTVGGSCLYCHGGAE